MTGKNNGLPDEKQTSFSELFEKFGMKKASEIEPPKKKEADDDGFWNISELVPAKKKTVFRPAGFDVSSALVEIDGNAEDTGEKIPERTETVAEAEVVECCTEYDGDGGLCHVKISPWPTRFSFYSHFAAEAGRYWKKKHEKCDAVSFFSYMPQYDQMNSSQKAYYLYWRDRVRHGEYPSVDCSYVLLYLYEIINLPGIVRPSLGARLLALVWAAYRDAYPYLDKYAGEWLCDYCLLYQTPVPCDIVAPFISDAAERLSIPELFSPACGGEIDFGFLSSCSSYDFKKSKYYNEYKEAFDKHIPAAALIGAKKYFTDELYSSIAPIRTVRDSFSGAVACHAVKFKIEVSYRSASKSRAVRDTVTAIFKLCENFLRAALGIKSRFTKMNLPGDIANDIKEYFGREYPALTSKRKKSDDEEYMKFYEPENSGGADIERAMKIENDAWQTAIELDGENIVFEEEAPNDGTYGSPFADNDLEEEGEAAEEDVYITFAEALPHELFSVLKASADGDFMRACAENRFIPDEAERRINELAFDITGDAVLENGNIIDDYRDDIVGAILEMRGRNG